MDRQQIELAGADYVDPNDSHTLEILKTVSIRTRNRDVIWPMLAPVVKVMTRSDKYFIWSAENDFGIENDALPPLGRATEIKMTKSDDNFSVNGRGLAGHIPLEMIRNNPDDPLAPEMRMMETLKTRLMNIYERYVSNTLFSASTYPTANKRTLSGNDQWSDHANSDPIDALLMRIEAQVVTPNTLALGSEVWQKMRTHPSVVAAARPMGGNAASGGVVTRQELADVLELDQVLVGRRLVNTAAPGAAANYTRVWGKHALLAYVDPNPSIDTISLAWTFCETESEPYREFDGAMGEKGAVYLRESWNEDLKVIAPDVGFFFENAVS